MSILSGWKALWYKGLVVLTVPVWAPETGTVLGLLYLFEHPKQERYCEENMEGDCQRWQEIKKYVEYCKGKVFVCEQYMGVIDFYSVLTYNRFRIINNNCKQYFFIFHVIKTQKYS